MIKQKYDIALLTVTERAILQNFILKIDCSQIPDCIMCPLYRDNVCIKRTINMILIEQGELYGKR